MVQRGQQSLLEHVAVSPLKATSEEGDRYTVIGASLYSFKQRFVGGMLGRSRSRRRRSFAEVRESRSIHVEYH